MRIGGHNYSSADQYKQGHLYILPRNRTTRSTILEFASLRPPSVDSI